MDEVILPDGSKCGTGLLIPASLATGFAEYEVAGPMLTMDEIATAAKSGKFRGFDRFDKSWVKNQRNKSSCNGFAEATALSKARVRRLGMKHRLDLSGAYAYSLINGGRDRGSMLDDGMEKCGTHGIATEATVPWDAIFRSQYDTAKADAEAAENKGLECYAVRTELALASALVNGFDVVVAVHAGNGFMQVNAEGIAQGDNGPGNHAVSADGIGWSEGLKCILFDHQGSWGTSYGQQGRAALTWARHFAQTTQYHVFYAVKSTTDPKA